MSNNEKQNNDLEEFLSNMPKFTDSRSKEEVYNRVQLEVNSSKINKVKRNNSFSRWMPLIVSIASVLLLTLLVSSYLETSNQESAIEHKTAEQPDTMRTMDVTPASETEMDRAEKATEEAAIENKEESLNSLAIESAALSIQPFNNARTVYEDDLNDGVAFHFSLTKEAYAYPITIIISKGKINEDFPDGWPNSLQLYERYAGAIDEVALGFDDYLPFQGNFVSVGDTLQHYLPEGHEYDRASATTSLYGDTISYMFNDFSYLERLNEDGTPINWDQVGVMGKENMVNGIKKQVYYKQTMSNGLTFLVPKDASFENAFTDIQKSVNDYFTTVVPKGVSYEVKEEGNTVVITFDETLDLATLDYEDSILMIEAFTLTAASFDKTVRLENVEQKIWDRFDLTTTLPIPMGPNGYMRSDIK
ncbi:MAG: hypothetical protein ABS934_09130 [Psychrobacillus sp.]